MTCLATDVASLAASLGAIASNMTGLVAVVAALHREAAGIVATFRAAACHVTSLIAIVTAQLRPLLTNNYPVCKRLYVQVASHGRTALLFISQLQRSENIRTNKVNIEQEQKQKLNVARCTNLLAILSNMANTIAAIAKILILFAFTCKVAKLVAFEALLAATSKTTVSITSTISSSSTSTLWALSRKVAHAVALVTRARTHSSICTIVCTHTAIII